jgi:AcrR family transcriptional regulator
MTLPKHLQPRKVPKQERSRALVDAIVEATARVLLDKGYDGLGVADVADVAGVSIGSLYQYFPSKEALVAARIERHAAE